MFKKRKKEDNTSVKNKTEEKINKLFDRTADEIFYDFFKKYNKYIIALFLTSVTLLFFGTYRYYVNIEYEKKTSEVLMSILDETNELEKDKKIQKAISNKSLKEKHKVSLLLLLKIKNKKDVYNIYTQSQNLVYVCQYPFNVYHFDEVSITTELLYLRVLYLLGKEEYIKEMKEFFMEKKMQCSVFSYYAYYILAFSTKDKSILNSLLDNTMITNLGKGLTYNTEIGDR